MVKVKRTEYSEIVSKKTGKILRPAMYECRYYSEKDGKEIGFYYSSDDVIYLKTDFIGGDFKRSVYDRAVTCERADEYRYLFGMLGVDRTSRISEYTNM